MDKTMNNVKNLFSQQVYEIEFPNYKDIQDDLIRYIETKFDKNFKSSYNNHEHPIKNGALIRLYDVLNPNGILPLKPEIENESLKKIFDFTTEHLKNYWKVLNYSDQLDPYILQLWVNVVKEGGFVASHNHNPVPISGVFYISAEPTQGNLFLENPLDLIIGKSPLDKKEMVPSRFHHEIEAKSGKLILFPGWMKHFTKENNTNDIRISMALNFGCCGQVYYTDLG